MGSLRLFLKSRSLGSTLLQVLRSGVCFGSPQCPQTGCSLSGMVLLGPSRRVGGPVRLIPLQLALFQLKLHLAGLY